MNKKNNRKGFTIVELVIVIAVIAILATVLVPTFGTVISDAKNTANLQNAKNVYTQYVAQEAKNGEYETDLFVALVDGTETVYVQVVDGQVVEVKAPAVGDKVITKGADAIAESCYNVTADETKTACDWCGTKH